MVTGFDEYYPGTLRYTYATVGNETKVFAYLAKAAKKLSLLVQYITLICGVNKMLYIETYCPM